jgi:elongation factor P
MSLSITNLKKGTIFQWEGVPYRVVEYSQKVMGRGGSIVNVRIKSLTDGKVLEKTFKGNEQLDSADVANRPVQYLYNDGNEYYFMDNDSYEQFTVAADNMEDKAGYLKEGDQVTAQLFDGRVINIELPKNVPLKVTYSENAVKGDTSVQLPKTLRLKQV